MYISPNDITAFEEQDIETVLADELADSEDRYEPTSQLDSRVRGKRNWLRR